MIDLILPLFDAICNIHEIGIAPTHEEKMIVIDQKLALLLAEKGEYVIKNTKSLYGWDGIISGTYVNRGDGTIKTERAVDQKTWRVFWKRNKKGQGASQVFDNYFLDKKANIIEELRNISSSQQFDQYLDIIGNEIKPFLQRMVSEKKCYLLSHYNVIRKPIDLYFANLVSMSKELKEDKHKLIEFLFVPLDTKIIKRVTLDVLSKHNIKHGSGFTGGGPQKLDNVLSSESHPKERI